MRIRGLAVVVCSLLPRAAHAGAKDDAMALWQKDLGDLATMFDFPTDGSASTGTSLAYDAELTCTDVSPDSVFGLALGEMTSACTASIPSSNPTDCRVAAVTLIGSHRWDELARGDDSGFTFEVTCEGYVITGEVHPFHAESGDRHDNGLISADEAETGGGSYGSYHLQVGWEKLPPDVTDATQWRDAVLAPVWRTELVIARLQRAIKEGNAEDAESWRDYLATDQTVSALSEEQAFPAFPGDDSVRTAVIGWLGAVEADADHGDLKLLVDRVPHGTKQTKSYKRKTAAIAKRWKKASRARERERAHVVHAFDAAYVHE